MVAIDNFEHVTLAYGSGVAAQAMDRLRAALAEWLGGSADIHFESSGMVYGTWYAATPAAASVPVARPGSGWPGPKRMRAASVVNRLLINPPVLTIGHGSGSICLAISGTWGIEDGLQPHPARPFSGGCRSPFFGQLPGRDDGWAARYRADMAAVGSVFDAIEREPDSPTVATGVRSIAGAVFRANTPSEPMAPPRQQRAHLHDEQLVMAWRPVRDGCGGPEVLFYEMCPQLVGTDGRRRELVEVRPALERLGLAAAVDCHLVNQALDLLNADPDVALAVPVSAQSASACSRWSDVFRRLTGDPGVARRLTLSIAETASFPDFAETIQFVSRLQTFGVAVGIDNFGLGYTSIRELLALEPDIVCIDPFFVRYGSGATPEGAALGHLAGLASLLAATVVVKGVANERQSRLSLDAGIRWQQGDFLGTPSLGRAWTGRPSGRGACRLQDRSRRRPRAA